MTTSRPMVLRGAALAGCLAAVVLFGFRAAEAQVNTSLHDFSTGPNPRTELRNGACSHCHIPHGAQPNSRLWPRSLSQENTAYAQQVWNPNYAPGYTILCYDCHDTHLSAGPGDDDPADITFNSMRKPQDVVFDLDMKNPAPANFPSRDGSPTDDIPGYLENVPSGTKPPAATTVSGHYVKNSPGGGTGIAQGDKLPCSDCHDPHTRDNAAFIKRNLGGGDVTAKRASENMSYDTNPVDTSTRNDDESRDFCVRCHGTAEQTTYKAVRFSEINSSYGTNFIAKPTLNVSAHYEPQTVACTDCHYHNRIVASCNDCHGFPPASGAHQRHQDALGSILFDCAICHGPNAGSAPWHNQNNGTVLAANVDIMGETSWWGAGSNYYGVDGTSALQAGYAFEKKGGGDKVCYNLDCHGDPTGTTGDAGALNWTDDMVDDVTGAAAADIEVCAWCHDATPSALYRVYYIDTTITTPAKAPNIMGAGSGAAAWGAAVNGHGLASGNYEGDTVGEASRTGRPAANKNCAVCHDATYTAGTGPDKTHFDGAYFSTEKRLRDSINAKNLLTDIVNVTASPNDTILDAACIACHQYTGGDQGLQVSTHGNHFNGSVETGFQRECRACHEPHGRNWNGTGRNLHMVGTWLDTTLSGAWGATDAGEEARVDSNASGATPAVAVTTADAKVILTANSGENSYDDGFNDGLNPPDSVCVVCHADLVYNHNEATDVTTLRGAGHNPVGTNCITCHDHNKDNSAATADAFAPGACFSCHGTKTSDETPPGTQGTDWFAGQFWPDGSAALSQYVYADNQPGAHLRHVETVAAKVFNQTLAQLVTDTGLTSVTKQVVVCGFCHLNPGESGHDVNSAAAPSGTGRVDVFQGGAGNYFTKLTPGTHPIYGFTNFGDDTTGGAYNYPTGSCANLVCHNQASSPANGWSTPPTWTVTATCSTTTCHAPPTYAASSGVHSTHVAATGRGYLCTECHVANTSLQHQNASVDMNGTGTPPGAWNSPGSIEGTTGGGNGFYDKDGTVAASTGDTGFAYKNGSYAVTCYRIYCHGADNTATVPPDWDGGDTTPVWNDSENAPNGVYCGACHTGNGTGGSGFTNGTVVIATGSHTDHLTAAWGPGFGATGCVGNATTGCHPSHAVTSASHADGSVNFLNLDGTTIAGFAATTACDECHGASTANAKNQTNWDDVNYLLPCLECHDATNPANSARTGTAGGGVDAPAKSTYWATGTTAGHGLATGSTYGPSGRSGAGATCANCHLATSAHINATATTDRLTTSGNALCNGCHDGTSDGAGNKSAVRVSTHANTASFARYIPQRAAFELNCVECHDVHGTSNIYMMNTVNTNGPLVTPRQYGGVTNTGTFLMRGTVAFTDHSVGTSGTSGVGFADTNAGGNPTKICQTCHTATVHFEFDSTDTHFVQLCTACHPHEFDADDTTQDGFMPKGECEDCHDGSQPAAGNDAPNVMTYWASGGHGNGSFDPDGGGPQPSRGVECKDCHDVSVPASPASAGHDVTGGGTYNSIWANDSTRSSNTSHLKAEFFTLYPANAAGDWSIQIAMDNYCSWKCHDTDQDGVVDDGSEPANPMYHTGAPNAAGDYVIQFGKKQTPPVAYPNPDNIPDIPIDLDLNTGAAGGGNYAPCVSCHDPHGTDPAVAPVPGGQTSNRMMRFEYPTPDDSTLKAVLCAKCHK